MYTHIHALSNSSPKGQYSMDHLMQMVHSLTHICQNLMWIFFAQISVLDKLSPSFQLSDLLSSW